MDDEVPSPLGHPFGEIRVTVPAWVDDVVPRRRYGGDEERMRLTIDLAWQNVERGTGGPFGATIFSADGYLVGVGMHGVTRLHNSAAHAEVMAIMCAERVLHVHTLREAPFGPVTLYSSCEPCAMCLGAILWSGVTRVMTAAAKADAESLGIDEGPVFDASYTYLSQRGVEITRGFMRAEGCAVLTRFQEVGGEVY